MQILPGDVRVGAIVRVRRGRWRVVDIRSYERCQLVTIAGLAAPNAQTVRRVITPFDRLDSVERRRRPRIASTRQWQRTFRSLISADCPPGGIRAAAGARIELLPYQLEPAMAIVGGEASRLLLADEVGLGKTIQAGLVAAELLTRGVIDRVLILTPAGLRDQWRTELDTRFAINATVVDSRTLARLSAGLPPGVSPWTAVPIAVASIEFVKRTEVLAAAAAERWDLVVVDEAHGAATDSDRHAATHAICSRASYVLLITATPHNGDARAYESLRNLGTTGDGIRVFRRTRTDVGLGRPRRVHVISVGRTADEQRADAALAEYAAAVQRERGDSWLALSVLHKRAFSSAWSLAESVERRLHALAPEAGEESRQLPLPLTDHDGDFSPDDQAPEWPIGLSLANADDERRLLTTVAAAARRASGHESKIAAIARLLRRVAERLILFTEYRDTLEHVRRAIGPRAIALHGGMSRDERGRALARFARESRAVLLATDAAGEGLNLQDACRLVVNLELPWNPVRLEQRIGRVDRIGQKHRVHACHLVAAGTGEKRIFERLRSRVAIAQAAVGASDPLSADAVVERTTQVVVGANIAECKRIEQVRTLLTPAVGGVDTDRADGPLILVVRRSSTRQRLRSAAITLWQAAAEDAGGRRVECCLVPLLVRLDSSGVVPSRATARDLFESLEPALRPYLDDITRNWREKARRIDDAFCTRRLDRERGVARGVAGSRPRAYQAGLFDRRAERARRIASAVDSANFRGETRVAPFDRPPVEWRLDLILAAISL